MVLSICFAQHCLTFLLCFRPQKEGSSSAIPLPVSIKRWANSLNSQRLTSQSEYGSDLFTAPVKTGEALLLLACNQLAQNCNPVMHKPHLSLMKGKEESVACTSLLLFHSSSAKLFICAKNSKTYRCRVPSPLVLRAPFTGR